MFSFVAAIVIVDSGVLDAGGKFTAGSVDTKAVFSNSKEPGNRFHGINSASYVAWRARTTTLFLFGS
jgi:hypothetical protein